MKKVSEYDVLTAAALWLFREGYKLIQISLPGRQVIPTLEQRLLVEDKLKNSGVPTLGISFNSQGPDIIAENETRIWKVECKGLGEGKQSTLRNNFDRALGSVVSYYDLEDKELCLALAMPYNQDYNRHIINRVKKPLRRLLNLWILLYFTNNQLLLPFSPDSEFSDETILDALSEAMLKAKTV